MITGIDPCVDHAFRTIFGRPDRVHLLSSLLSSVLELPPGRGINDLALLLPESDSRTLRDKSVVGDIRARDLGHRQFHVEMQQVTQWFFPKRVLYYWSKFHPEHLREGEAYQTVRPTISVCFVNSVMYPEVADHHLVFRLRERHHNLAFCNDLEIHLIEVPKFTTPHDLLQSGLDRWCYFLRHGASLDSDVLPELLNLPEIREAMEVLVMFTQNDAERYEYEARLKARMDEASMLYEVRTVREAYEKAAKDLETAEHAAKAAIAARDNAELAAKAARENAELAAKAARENAELAAKAEKVRREVQDREARVVLIGRIQMIQELLGQPSGTREALLERSQEELEAMLAALRNQFSARG